MSRYADIVGELLSKPSPSQKSNFKSPSPASSPPVDLSLSDSNSRYKDVVNSKSPTPAAHAKKVVKPPIVEEVKNDWDDDVEMSMDDFYSIRRGSDLSFKQLVNNALNSDWLMDIDQHYMAEDGVSMHYAEAASNFEDDDVQVSR
jgi:hypothetical protein